LTGGGSLIDFVLYGSAPGTNALSIAIEVRRAVAQRGAGGDDAATSGGWTGAAALQSCDIVFADEWTELETGR
jgi:hypothetical protein